MTGPSTSNLPPARKNKKTTNEPSNSHKTKHRIIATQRHYNQVVPERAPANLRGKVEAYLLAVLCVAFVTAACAPFNDQINSTTAALAYLLVVLFVAMLWGVGPGRTSAVLAMLCFDYFFLPPLYTFYVSEPQNWIALVAFLVAASMVGHLSTRAKHRAEQVLDLYNHAPCGYHSLDKDGIVVRINDTELEWLGYARPEVTERKRFSDFLTPEGLKVFERNFPKLKEGKPIEDLELDLVRRDGTTIPVLLSATAVTDTKGNFLMSRSTVFDITMRQREEQARSQMAAIVESSDDAIVSKDLNERVLTWNKAAERIYGYTAAEMVGKPISILAPPEKQNEFPEIIARLKRGESIEHLETVRVRKDGRTIEVSLTISPIRDTDGEIVAAATISRDITDRKRAEREIRQLAQLQAVVSELGQRALRSDSSRNAMDQAVDAVARALGVEYCKVLELQPDAETLRLRAGAGFRKELIGRATVSAGIESQAGFTLLSDQPVVLEDLSAETRFKDVPMFGEPLVKSGISVVISTSDGPWGVLSAHTTQRRSFTPNEVHFLQSIANVLGAAIEREKAEQEILRTNRAHRALSTSNQALVRATNETGLLDQICRIVVSAAGYLFCWAGRAEQDDTKTVRPIAQAGFCDGYLETAHITWADTERGRGPTGTCIRTGVTQVAKHIATEPSFEPWRAEALKRGFQSSIAIPLFVDSKPYGALTIYSKDPEAFNGEEVDLLTELAGDIGYGITALHTQAQRMRAEEEIRSLNADLENRVLSRTALLQAANRELEQAREREISTGFRIQQTLLLDQPPADIPGLRAAALTIPSQRIDGDFYIFVRHSDECLDAIVGDVMGKGIPAALLGAATKTQLLKALCDLTVLSKGARLPEPREIIARAHAGLARHLIELDSFVTLCYARLDLNRLRLDLVDCGHTGVVHRHSRTGRIEILHGDNLPLGVREGEVYDQISVPFDPGDLFFFFSDGITEARSAAGQFFGVERLEEFLSLNAQLDPAALVEGIRKAVMTFSGTERLADDLTSVALRVEPRDVLRTQIDITSDLSQLGRVREFVRSVCQSLPRQPMDDESEAALELAVNEAASNVIKHAYHGRGGQCIRLEAEVSPGRISILLSHLGDSFDPASAPPPALDGSRESGFGTFIIAQSVDEVRYYRDENGRNYIALAKRIDGNRS